MLKDLLSKIFTNTSDSETVSQNFVTPPQKIFLFHADQTELKRIIESPNIEGKAPGYVYFVQEHLNGTFKIGKTKNINKRMNLFNVKLPFDNELVFLIKSGNHHQTEAAFHKNFSSKRLEGEWFALDKQDINWIKEGNYPADIAKTIDPFLDIAKKQKKTDTSNQLTNKQIEYAKSMIKRLEQDYELIVDYSSLTKKDLDRLSVYFRYKNIGALNNLVKNGVLRLKH